MRRSRNESLSAACEARCDGGMCVVVGLLVVTFVAEFFSFDDSCFVPRSGFVVRRLLSPRGRGGVCSRGYKSVVSQLGRRDGAGDGDGIEGGMRYRGN